MEGWRDGGMDGGMEGWRDIICLCVCMRYYMYACIELKDLETTWINQML